MVREDLVEGAVTFLQDPSVSSSPVEQKIAFLRSKNLTQEEIDVSLSRVGQPPPSTQSPQSSPNNYPQQYRPPPQQYQNQYGPYPQQPYWPQGPPPETPRRDWRDWFIMATVASGASYALYWTAKRYIYPLIAPPTPPQLEQDKASIDSSFEQAFALLDQLATDTNELKESEKARKERLDSALGEVESVVGKMKEANESREQEAKRLGKELLEIKEQIPETLKKEKEATEERLKELIAEMKSLRTLVDGRLGAGPRGGAGPGAGQGYSARGNPSARPAPAATTTTPQVNGSPAAPTTLPNGFVSRAPPPSVENPSTTAAPSSASAPGPEPVNGSRDDSTSSQTFPPERSNTSSPYGRIMGGGGSGKAAIPAWQLAAAAANNKKKGEEIRKEAAVSEIPGVSVPGITDSGTTVAEGEGGAA